MQRKSQDHGSSIPVSVDEILVPSDGKRLEIIGKNPTIFWSGILLLIPINSGLSPSGSGKIRLLPETKIFNLGGDKILSDSGLWTNYLIRRAHPILIFEYE
jgi:hypothetical protein